MRAASVIALFALYTLGLLGWFVFIGQVALLEADVGERFLRLSGWPTRVMVLGLVWTALLAVAVLAAFRTRRKVRALSLATATLVAITVTVFMPWWFRQLGYFGISTGEFLDALFPLLGGVLPGGQATLGLWILCASLATLTVAAATRSSHR